MATIAELEAQREQLRKILHSGVQRVRYQGVGETEFWSRGEIAAALGDLDSELASAGGGTRRRQIRLIGDKGL